MKERFTEDDLKSQRRFGLAPQPKPSGENQALLMPHLLMVMKVTDLLCNNIQSQKLMVSTKIQLRAMAEKQKNKKRKQCTQQQKPNSNKQQQAKRIRQQ